MNITITGVGYLGLVTGTCLAEVGHNVTCFDVDSEKINNLSRGICPIYEPNLEELINKNISYGRLQFTDQPNTAYSKMDIIIITVGTPEDGDGSANLSYLEKAVYTLLQYVNKNTIIATKSTVPVGTNDWVREMVNTYKPSYTEIEVVSIPEFLREGSGIQDTFYGDRIVVGSNSSWGRKVIEKMYQPFNIPIVHTDIRSAEMIKYASNTFLATKISFINEIANICELTGANIEDVAKGMGMDKRIGEQFLFAGLGYGGSCFPKDIKALNTLAKANGYTPKILKAVMSVNDNQINLFFEKARKRINNFDHIKVAILGLSFKPNTNDIRNSPAETLIKKLLKARAEIHVYDPVATNEIKDKFGDSLNYAESIIDTINNAEVCFIVTDWPEIKSLSLNIFENHMKTPLVVDGRNCYTLEAALNSNLTYISIGRSIVERRELATKVI
ncbi:UDP-glucose/GDP-mannose dehydrogenase family protein [Bacillus infantis]|uniref:UDP-glucose 6-dehydrogenase n=1 Tax=Bacillus infantis TaxID=324767 RepID=A0A5D4SEL3_9BACI|nr:UDP-glucose/GDP-mannose dehydrogenase family protein [Bacillus infantis]TYS60554.1 UDP-glucose/GDP-mannose dehydrogenase family protein [Bacillus infantis]